MTKSFMQDHRNEEVHRFQRHAASSADTVCDCLVHRNGSSDALPHEVYPKTMLKHWPMALIAAAASATAQIHRHPVNEITWSSSSLEIEFV